MIKQCFSKRSMFRDERQAIDHIVSIETLLERVDCINEALYSLDEEESAVLLELLIEKAFILGCRSE